MMMTKRATRTNNEMNPIMTTNDNIEKTTCYLAMNVTDDALPMQLDFFVDTYEFNTSRDVYAPAVSLLTRLFPAPRYDIDRLTDEIHVYDTTRHAAPDDDDYDPDDVDAPLLIVSYQYE